MGVQGLWTLISPVARPINLETMGNKKLAIDSSIWLYQFQKAMRDREGKGIVNAHILGFLRRISKLLYYGIKPVFVFDGGVPTLKRQTINERKKQKRGVQDNLAKTAEKLLAAQLRQVAVMEAQKRTQVKATGDLITPHTVYFGHPIAQDFSEKNNPQKQRQSDPTDTTTTTPIPSPTKKTRFIPKDQYQLPPIDKIPSATETDTDHRLATEMELKEFIHEFTTEDLDINSPHFQSLSTELKYEIIGDLRVKSRQPNRTRVEAMRKTNDHEFSQTQILNLKKRNNLTQKLLTVTDMVAKANLTIPIKIAAQRNKEYVLVKASEGWILGIENEDEKEETGSIKNPVKVDVEESEDEDVEFEEVKVDRPLRTGKGVASRTSDDEIEFEEVPLPTPTIKLKASREQQEADWREAIRFHYGTTDSNSVVDLKETSVPRPKDDVDLFQQSDEDEDEVIRDIISEVVAHEAFRPSRDLGEGSSKETTLITPVNRSSDSLKHQFSTSVTGPLSAESCPPVASKQMINILESVELEMDDDFLIPEPLAKPQTAPQIINLESVELEMDDDFLIQEPPIENKMSYAPTLPTLETEKAGLQSNRISADSHLAVKETTPLLDHNQILQDLIPHLASTPTQGGVKDSALNQDQNKLPAIDSNENQTTSSSKTTIEPKEKEESIEALSTTANIKSAYIPNESVNSKNVASSPLPETHPLPSQSTDCIPTSPSKPHTTQTTLNDVINPVDKGPKDTANEDKGNTMPRSESPEISIPWSRTPTPQRSTEKEAEVIGSDEEEFNRVIEAEEQAIDANLVMESNEWDSFLLGLEDQEKLEGIRQDADLEVQRLKEKTAKDRRDADDVTIQMSKDIQNLLKLFGIPFVESPMEAEAQCAELLKLELVDGIITDDSDVFLFGGNKVYKNLFNQNKFVECYLLNDLDIELGLNQEKLIQLAFLLGSDYTVGLNGVGPVTAMEILAEFDPDFSSSSTNQTGSSNLTNLTGLLNFKNWWEKVQVGKDTELESGTTFKKKFCKKKDKIWIDDHWPNPAVADAYLNPIVDHSTEKFIWGLPDLEGIKEFLYDHLSWSSIKTDEVIIPLIKRQTQRLNGTIQTQGVLDGFFDYSIESNSKSSQVAPPGIDSGFSSQRLQKIISKWREKKKNHILNNNKSLPDQPEEPEEQPRRSSSKSEEAIVVKGPNKRTKPTKSATKKQEPAAKKSGKIIKPKELTKIKPVKQSSAAAPANEEASSSSHPTPINPSSKSNHHLTTQSVRTRSSKRKQSTLSKTHGKSTSIKNTLGGKDQTQLSSDGDQQGSGSEFDLSSSFSEHDDDEEEFRSVKKKKKKT
ncbi:hypothetical protein MJO28_006235 [Puccinia striiformis f. sp. tritici]|uniref:Uncharacterized protein n=1 Tax=Puccinia striiformis f. sp. tritici TaxID=168172 RepID=A0ACC0EGJ0_9BASI|nr:hypothetical protein MJO28_006235 [Puccinia striiformis f. sp. tritici]